MANGLLYPEEEIPTQPMPIAPIAPGYTEAQQMQVPRTLQRQQAPPTLPPEPESRGLLSRIGGTIGKGLLGAVGLPFMAAREVGGRLIGAEGNTPEQRAARNAALRRAGLEMMMHSRTRSAAGPPDPFRSIAGGLLSGQEAYPEQLARNQKETWQRRVQQITGGQGFEGLTNAQWDKLLVEAMQYSPDMVPYLTEVRKTTTRSSDRQWIKMGPRKMALVDQQGTIYDTREVPTAEAQLAPRVYTDEATGRTFMGVFRPDPTHPQGGEVVDIGYGPPLSEEMRDKQQSAVMFYSFGSRVADQMAQVEEAPGKLNSELVDLWKEGMLFGSALWEQVPEHEQALFSDGVRFGEGWLRLTTGAAYNNEEYKNAMLMFVPMAGDSRGLLRRKTENRAVLMKIMATLALGKRLTYEELQELASGTSVPLYGAARFEKHGDQEGATGAFDPDAQPVSGQAQQDVNQYLPNR